MVHIPHLKDINFFLCFLLNHCFSNFNITKTHSVTLEWGLIFRSYILKLMLLVSLCVPSLLIQIIHHISTGFVFFSMFFISPTKKKKKNLINLERIRKTIIVRILLIGKLIIKEAKSFAEHCVRSLLAMEPTTQELRSLVLFLPYYIAFSILNGNFCNFNSY